MVICLGRMGGVTSLTKVYTFYKKDQTFLTNYNILYNIVSIHALYNAQIHTFSGI